MTFKARTITLWLGLIGLAVLSLIFNNINSSKEDNSSISNIATTHNGNTAPTNTTPETVVTNTNTAVTSPENTNTASPTPTVVLPIADFYSRITKKPFGIYITPATSPIQPEKFTGYHTGADAEITDDEKNTDLVISAVADGQVVAAQYVNGYGGVMLIRHTIGTETVTALYGHLRVSSLTKKNGDSVKLGEKIGVLGTGFSSETDGERKHLHFGVIKGDNINYKGYVTEKSALSDWEDPMAWLKSKGSS